MDKADKSGAPAIIPVPLALAAMVFAFTAVPAVSADDEALGFYAAAVFAEANCPRLHASPARLAELLASAGLQPEDMSSRKTRQRLESIWSGMRRDVKYHCAKIESLEWNGLITKAR